jgi:hypothetical protein
MIVCNGTIIAQRSLTLHDADERYQWELTQWLADGKGWPAYSIVVRGLVYGTSHLSSKGFERFKTKVQTSATCSAHAALSGNVVVGS